MCHDCVEIYVRLTTSLTGRVFFSMASDYSANMVALCADLHVEHRLDPVEETAIN